VNKVCLDFKPIHALTVVFDSSGSLKSELVSYSKTDIFTQILKATEEYFTSLLTKLILSLAQEQNLLSSGNRIWGFFLQ